MSLPPDITAALEVAHKSGLPFQYIQGQGMRVPSNGAEPDMYFTEEELAAQGRAILGEAALVSGGEMNA